MATLTLAARNEVNGLEGTTGPTPLRAWLREGWAILFSHPDDFARFDLEMDRWLVVTQQAFAARRIRPLALHSAGRDPSKSWVAQVSGDNRTVLLDDPLRQSFDAVDLQAHSIREDIALAEKRFVMIIDSELRKQRMFTYSDLSNLPSPLDFLACAGALRAKQDAETRTTVTPLRHHLRPAHNQPRQSRAGHPHDYKSGRLHCHDKWQVHAAR